MAKKNTPPTPVLPVVKVTLKSYVPSICESKGWTRGAFIDAMRDVGGVREVTSGRIFKGETNMKTDTLARVALVLNVPISKVIDFDKFTPA